MADPARSLRWINAVGVVAACVAAAVLIAQAPARETLARESTRLATAGAALQLEPATLSLLLPDPPILSFASRDSEVPLSLSVVLPDSASARLLTHLGEPLQPTADGARLVFDRRVLRWGLNPLHIQGIDPFGRPLDQAWPLLVGDTADADTWIESAVEIHLAAAGFQDTDDRLDDLAAIARHQIQRALRQLPPIEAGPIVVSNWRAGDVEVDLRPEDGGVAVHVALANVHVDIAVEPIGTIQAFGINRMWLYAGLRVDVHRDGSPAVWIEGVEPHVDINRAGDSVGDWILDRGAWFLEVTAELLSEEPIREALTGALDRALEQWVSRYTIESPPPLAAREFQLEYRFAALDLSPAGLDARVDVRVTCEGEAGLGRLTHPSSASAAAPPALAEDAVVRVLLRSDAVNGVLHALWRCGAMNAEVGFDEAHAAMPLAAPARVALEFGLPPVLQAGRNGEMLIGIGGVAGRLDYVDSVYTVNAVGLLPIALAPTEDGRGLVIRFAAESPALELYTDCVDTSRGSCRDNPLFDRLAWLAVPYLPPIGATLPLPDLRISTDPDTAVRVQLLGIDFDPSGAFLEVRAGYEAGAARNDNGND